MFAAEQVASFLSISASISRGIGAPPSASASGSANVIADFKLLKQLFKLVTSQDNHLFTSRVGSVPRMKI
jgi:hypothetical protein